MGLRWFSSSCLLSFFVFGAFTSAANVTTSKITFDIRVRDGLLLPIRDESPLGLSLEFFELAHYMKGVNTLQCLENLESALGAPLSIRVGGTSQDRALFDPALKEPIKNFFENRDPLPTHSVFGPEFIRLARKFKGPVTLGLARRSNKMNNTVRAIHSAIENIPTLFAVEFGNEPEYWGRRAPIARNARWDPEADAKSQIDWQKEVSRIVGKPQLVQAGVYLTRGKWSIADLAAKIKAANATGFVRSFGRHAYPQSGCAKSKTSLPKLMSHAAVAKFTRQYFTKEIEAARALQKPYYFSETNSANCQGGAISMTFGASLWLMDYLFQALMTGVDRIYFHQAKLNMSRYNFWGDSRIFAPFYGAYFAARALQGARHLTTLNSTDPNQIAYAFYRSPEQLSRVLVYNSEVYPKTAPGAAGGPKGGLARPVKQVTLSGLPGGTGQASLLRLTAPSAYTGQKNDKGPTVGGSRFVDKGCKLDTAEKSEVLQVEEGSLRFFVAASEAVLIDFTGSQA